MICSVGGVAKVNHLCRAAAWSLFQSIRELPLSVATPLASILLASSSHEFHSVSQLFNMTIIMVFYSNFRQHHYSGWRRQEGQGKLGEHRAPAVPKKQMWRRQTSPVRAAATATLPAAQGDNNAMMLQLLMDLSSHMSVTEKYIAQHREAESVQTPTRLARTGVGAFQPGWEQPLHVTWGGGALR